MTHTFLFIGGLGAGELLLIALVVLLMFGGSKVPELMRGLGRGIREFNSAKNAGEADDDTPVRDNHTTERPPVERNNIPR